MEVEIARHRMTGNDGHTYVVVEVEQPLYDRAMAGVGRFPGSRRLQLEDGREVASIDGKLAIRASGVILDGPA